MHFIGLMVNIWSSEKLKTFEEQNSLCFKPVGLRIIYQTILNYVDLIYRKATQIYLL